MVQYDSSSQECLPLGQFLNCFWPPLLHLLNQEDQNIYFRVAGVVFLI